MTDKDSNRLLSMGIGDGHVRMTSKGSGELCIGHCLDQKEYCLFKRNIVSKILGKKINIYSTLSEGHKGVRFMVGDPHFKNIRSQLYNNEGKKVITQNILNKIDDWGMAIWYMDDGSFYPKKRNGKVHAYELVLCTYFDGEEEAEMLIKHMLDTYAAKFTIKRNKGKFSIRCGTRQARKFLNYIEPYLIPSMYYKTFKFYEHGTPLVKGEEIVQPFLKS